MLIKIKLSRQENIDYYKSSEITLDLEEYLKGVVPSEIGNSHIEACAAQAIAARNFTLNQVAAKGYITDKSTIDQAFRASRLTGYPNAYTGIEKTAGQLLYYDNKRAKCFYSHSNGGRTVSYNKCWGGPNYPYLIEQNDPYDTGTKNGHGVGMSQVGASNMAKQGFSYKEILAFYFPGTVLGGEKNKMTIEQFLLNWMTERIGNPYIYGATQKKCTVSYRQARAAQYPSFASKIKNNCHILSGKGTSCTQCKWYDKENNIHKDAYDCAQFIRWGAKAAGLPTVVSGATSQWRSNIWEVKGEFKDVPSDKLCCVFRDDNGTKEHVGWYYNGYAYHAQGHANGVVKTDNKQYTKWTHYAIMKGIYDQNGNPIEIGNENIDNEEVYKVLYKAIVTAEQGKTVNMRNDSSTSAKVLKQIPLGTPVDVLEELNGWSRIGCDGTVGFMMSKYLKKIDNELEDDTKEETTYYVKIKCNSASEAKRLAELLGQATAE